MGKPVTIVSDNGTEFTSNAILSFAQEQRIDWHYSAPGKPTQNASQALSTNGIRLLRIEKFNVRLCDEFLNETCFPSLAWARAALAAWRQDYNNERLIRGVAGERPPSSFRPSPATWSAPAQYDQLRASPRCSNRPHWQIPRTESRSAWIELGGPALRSLCQAASTRRWRASLRPRLVIRP